MSSSSSSSSVTNLISVGETVVVRSHDQKCVYIVKAGTAREDQKIGKSRVSLKEVIGHPYGSVFQQNNRKLELVTNPTTYESTEEMDRCEESELQGEEVQVGDNSGYVDSNTAQKLSLDDITKLKQSVDCDGTKIIKTLMSNSSTFNLKTTFAQVYSI